MQAKPDTAAEVAESTSAQPDSAETVICLHCWQIVAADGSECADCAVCFGCGLRPSACTCPPETDCGCPPDSGSLAS